MTETTRRFEGAVSSFWRDGASASISVAGTVSAADGAAILAGCRDDLGGCGAPALLADYRQARMLLTAEALIGSAAHAFAQRSPLRIPTALLVAPGDREMWALYCRLQGRAGVLRAAFTVEAEARRWLADQAAVFAAQINRHARRQSP